MTVGRASIPASKDRHTRSSFSSLCNERDRLSAKLPSSTGSSGENNNANLARSSFTSSGGDRTQQRFSLGSLDSVRSPSASPTHLHPNNAGHGSHNHPHTTAAAAAAAAAPNNNNNAAHNCHSNIRRGSVTSQRGSVSSRVSSLTRDSSIHSLDPLKIEISDLTHMFGRSKEQELLLSAFHRALKQPTTPMSGASEKRKELVMIHGNAGTGKTALVLDFKDAVSSTGTGYFCSGEFVQYQAMATPYDGIVQALNDLCQSILLGQEKEQYRFALFEHLGHGGLRKLVRVLPKLRRLLYGTSSRAGDDDDDDDDDDHEHEHDERQRVERERARKTPRGKSLEFLHQRIHEFPTIFRDFLRVLCRGQHPIIFFLDNLQWADRPSIEWFTNLVRDSSLNNLMVLGAYRDDEVCNIPILTENHGYTLTDICLDNLPLASVDDILSDLTGSPGVKDLAKIVLEKTHGNPLSIFQFLEMLQRKELLVFSFHTHKWIWDVEQIRIKTEVTQNVGHSLRGNIDKLSRESRKLLTLAAVIGFSFEPKVVELIAMHLEILEMEYREHLTNTVKGVIQDAISGGLIHPDQTQAVMATQMELVEEGSTTSLKRSFYEECTQAAIQEADVEGLIGKAVSRSKYKFSHDLVHKSCYEDTTLDIERHKLHLLVGRILRAFYTSRPEDDLLFAAVDHLNKGSHYLDTDDERIDLVQLNQKASEKARARSALFSAANFSSKAIDILKFEHDWLNHYDLLLHVYNDAAELNFACGRFDLSLRRCLEIHRHARSLEDKLAASYIRIEVLFSQKKIFEAIQSCLALLSSLGEPLAEKPASFQILAEWRKTKAMMKGLKPESLLLSLPTMQSPIKRQTQRYLSLLVNMCFSVINDKILPMAILKMFQNALSFGNCDLTPFSIAGYGMLCTFLGSCDEAAKYGRLAIELCEKMESNICIPSTYAIVYSTLHHLRSPLLEGIEPLLKAYRVGVANGEVQYAATSTAISVSMGFCCALPLKSYMEDVKNVCDQLKLLKQECTWSLVVPYWRAAVDLTGAGSGEDWTIARDVFDNLVAQNNVAQDGQIGLMWRNYHMVTYIVSYIFNNFDAASQKRKTMNERSKQGPKSTHFMVYFEMFFSGLLDFALYRKRRRWGELHRARAITKTFKRLVKEGAVNCMGMSLLLQAELASLGRNVEAAKRLYEDSMKSFAASGFIHLQAIANERLADFLKLKNKPPLVWQSHLRTATKLYAEWGAGAKVSQLINVHRMPARYSMGDTPCSIISIHGEKIERFAPIRGHIKEEEFISSDFISSDMLTKT